MNLIKWSLLKTAAIAAFWLVSFSVAGQEETASEPAPPPPESVATPPESPVAPASPQDQMLAGEFELLQQESIIESASKRAESVFASPFSSDVITRDQIQKSGARTIPEALRLLPGVIVREQSSGNFDVHIRGMDNVPPGSTIQDMLSNSMLVMIDYRVVYNYYLGGTYWETLPIDIIDVERIEIVRGPTAAMYGPNAATGVINIITRKLTTNGLHASARMEGALSSRDSDWSNNFRLGQRILSGRIGYKKDALSGGVSANYLSFDRLENGLYSYALNRRVPREQLIIPYGTGGLSVGGAIPFEMGQHLTNPAKVYPEPNLGRRSVGVNAFTAYEPTEKLSFVLTGGYQESRSLREVTDSIGNYSPFSTVDVQSWYLDLCSRFYNFTLKGNFISGHEVIPTENLYISNGTGSEFFEHKYNNLDLSLDYDFEWNWLRVRPEVSYRRISFSGPSFSTWENDKVVDDTAIMQSAAASVRLEQAFWNKVRFIEAVRLDFYFDRTENRYYPVGSNSLTDDKETKHGQVVYPSLQFAVTYTPADDHILRASYARANKSPSMSESMSYNPRVYAAGNKALNLLTFDTVELGYRTRVSKQFDLSIDVFGTYARDFTNPFPHGFDLTKLGEGQIRIIEFYDNYDLTVYQLGATVSFGFNTRRFNGRAFITLQQTQIKDFDSSIFTLALSNSGNSNKPPNEPHVGTPDVFGGFFVNYQPADEWNINVNTYFFSRHTQSRSNIPTGNILTDKQDVNPITIDIQQSFLLNAKVSYNFWDGLTAFVNLRNLFNINQRQFIWGDANHILCFVGLQYEL